MEKHVHENVLKSLKIDNDFYKKIYKSLNKKNALLSNSGILLGSGSAITTSRLTILKPSIGIMLASSTALLTSIAILVTNEFISKLKIRFTKLLDWIKVISLLYEKTLKQSMVEKK